MIGVLAMGYGRFQSLSPGGLVIDNMEIGSERILIDARCRAAVPMCPACGQKSDRVHSRYRRRLLDLPSHGRIVQLRIAVRRFRCSRADCPRQTFNEQLGEEVAGRSARRTSRLEVIVRHLGIALGGPPTANLARRLMLPVSKDTLLRVVRRHAVSNTQPLRVVGIDDWAWKRGQRYGTIVCDLERRCIVDLLPDRETGTVEAWLAQHPEIAVISRDRGGGYGPAAARAAPQATQVADRWHLMENASAAFLEAVQRSMRSIRQARRRTQDPIRPDDQSSDDTRRDHLARPDAIIVAAVENAVPRLAAARDLTERFHEMLRARAPDDLPSWIQDAAGSLLGSFGKGIAADRTAVGAALTESWSNAQTEGQITRLKLVKRQMYGRAKLDLLRARLLAPAY